MTTTTRTRPAGAPAYYLGRPAHLWRSALRHRAHRPVDATHTAGRVSDRMVARYSGAIR
jgi:hypothetical protein